MILPRPMIRTIMLVFLSAAILQSCRLFSGENPEEVDRRAEIHSNFFKPFLFQNFQNISSRPSFCDSCEQMKLIPAHALPFGQSSFFSDGRYEFSPNILVEFPRYWMDSTEITWGDVRKWLGPDTAKLRLFNLYNTVPEMQGRNTDHRPFSGNWFQFAFIANARSRYHGLDSVYQYRIIVDNSGYLDSLLDFGITEAAGFRFPSFAQWQAGCRAGKTWRHSWGNDSSEWRGYANLDGYGRSGMLADFLLPVASLKPNSLGLYDMIGNTSEWVEDRAYISTLVRLAEAEAPDVDTLKIYNPKVYDTLNAGKGSLLHGFTGWNAFDKVQWADCYCENTRTSNYEYFGARFIIEDP